MAFFFWPENLNVRKELRPNNIIHSTADQTEALELANLIIPLLCQSVKRKRSSTASLEAKRLDEGK